MKKTGGAALMCAALLALTACSAAKVDKDGAVNSGTVIGKRYLPAEYVKVNGQFMTKPECYRLNLNDKKGRIGPVCVSSSIFNMLKIGDKYNV